jgi:hypothetical protein
LFRKNNNFYLGVMDKKHNKIFEKIEKSNSKDSFEKIVYNFAWSKQNASKSFL